MKYIEHPYFGKLNTEGLDDYDILWKENIPSVRACPAGASDTVDVVFGLGRQFVVDDEGQLGDVQSACGDVGGDEDAQAAFFEGVEGFKAALLGFVAVDGLGGKVAAHEVAGHLIDALFGFAEHDDLVHLQIDNQPL